MNVSDPIRTDEEIYVGLASYKNTDGELSSEGIEDFKYLQDEYKNYVCHIIRLYSNSFSHEEIEDLSQETFSDLFTAIGSFNAKSLLKTYLYTIALNRARQYVRKTLAIKRGGGEQNIPLDDIEIDIPNSTKPPDESAIDSLAAEDIRKKAGNLAHGLRDVIELRFFEGKAYREIAKELDIPEGSVGSHLRKALDILRSMVLYE